MLNFATKVVIFHVSAKGRVKRTAALRQSVALVKGGTLTLGNGQVYTIATHPLHPYYIKKGNFPKFSPNFL